MEGFTYTNIFDTKGIEYLIIIAFLILVVPFWRLLNKPLKIKVKAGEASGVLNESILRIPQGLFYSKNHTWAHLEKSGYARLGLDDLLMHITGGVELGNLKNPGDRVEKGELIAELRQNGKLLKIVSPLSGEIQSFNTLLEDNPEILNEDPYGKGWICSIKPDKWLADTNSCLLAEDALAWAKSELTRFKDFAAMSMKQLVPETPMVILQEGGELSDNPLIAMPEEIWRKFQKEFLDTIS
ncbi:MAG: glycine cleavage system protein H [Bacteroidales bacterium]|nr:glycine cleavage system protein H [Bacteroidales bacterium]